MVRVREVHKSFGRIRAVRGVTFDLARGEVTGLLGSNGAGKTTTIRMITGFLPPDAGSISIDGHDTVEDSRAARRCVGYLPESAPAYPEMAVRDYLHFRGKLVGMSGRARSSAVSRVMDRCWLNDVRTRRIGHLSKGYRQRVGLAAALVHDPKVLVLDEPANGLDPAQIREMRRLILELGSSHAVLVSSHVLPEVEKTCQRVIILAGGRVRVDARPAELARSIEASTPYAIELKRAEATRVMERLRASPGVQAVAIAAEAPPDDGWIRLTIVPAPGSGDCRRELLSAAIDAGAEVREFHRASPGLERVFLGMIESDEPGGSEAPA